MSWVVTAVASTVAGGVVGGYFADKAAGQQADAANNATAAQLQMFNKTQENLQPYMDAGQSGLDALMAGTTGNYQDAKLPGGQAGYDAALAEYNKTQAGPANILSRIGIGVAGNTAPVLADYMSSGTKGDGSLMPKSYTNYDMTAFQNSPEYQAMLQQNAGALNSSQNASSLSGGANSNNMKSLMNWTQGNTVNQYQSGLSDYLQQFLTGNQARAQQFGTYQTIAGMGQNAAAGLGGISANVGGQIGENMIGAGNAQAAGTVGVGNAITGAMGQGYNQWLQNAYLNKYDTAATNAFVDANDPVLNGY